MALDHPFDAPAKHQLQQVLDFVARKTDINDQDLDTQSVQSTSPSPSPHRHGAPVATALKRTFESAAFKPATILCLGEELNTTTLDESGQNYDITQTSTSLINPSHDYAAIDAMAPKRKNEIEEFGKSTKPFLRDDFVTVKLDGSSSSYKVSKAMLCHASPYFVKALNGSFKEGKDRTLRLPDCDEDTFELFIGYLANNPLPDYKVEYESLEDSDGPQGLQTAMNMAEASQKRLISLWSFSDACLMPKLQNEAMRHFLGLSKVQMARRETITLAYEVTTGGSALRTAVVDELVHDYMSGMYDTVSLLAWLVNGMAGNGSCYGL